MGPHWLKGLVSGLFFITPYGVRLAMLLAPLLATAGALAIVSGKTLATPPQTPHSTTFPILWTIVTPKPQMTSAGGCLSTWQAPEQVRSAPASCSHRCLIFVEGQACLFPIPPARHPGCTLCILVQRTHADDSRGCQASSGQACMLAC